MTLTSPAATIRLPATCKHPGHRTARQGKWTKWEGHKHGEWKWDYPTNPFAPGSIQFRAFNMQRLGLVRT